jgi:RNA polymerase sigma-70 factor (ECF subfamily)
MAQEQSGSRPTPRSHATSRSLLQRAREQQPDAWERLVLLYSPLVRHWCRRARVAKHDIDDVVQEVFTKAFAVLEQFRHRNPTDTFRAWLHGVTQYRILEYLHRRRRQVAAAGGSAAQHALEEQRDPDLPPDGDEEANVLFADIFHRSLEFIRGEFEPRTWQMFWRTVVDGLPTATVCAELGVSTSSVRQARSRILRRLREELAELNLEPPAA